MARRSPSCIPPDLDLTDREYERFTRIIYETSRIALNDSKKELLRARIGRILRSRGIASFREYLALVEGDRTGEELTTLLDAVSTNLTSFFREAHHWIHCGDHTWPFSFENICHTLDIDASYVRGKVRRWLRPVAAPTRRQMTLRIQSCTGGAGRAARLA